jgi:uncharacterized membrane protein
LRRLKKQKVLDLADAATVVRRADGKVKVKQAVDLVGAGAFGGAFWGMLIGLIFWMPWLGIAIGAITGAIAGRFTDIGIDDSFIKQVGATIEPDHSALFLLTNRIIDDRVLPALQKYHPTVLRTSLSAEDEEKLRAAFGAGE